jgi:hypothetical protein
VEAEVQVAATDDSTWQREAELLMTQRQMVLDAVAEPTRRTQKVDVDAGTRSFADPAWDREVGDVVQQRETVHQAVAGPSRVKQQRLGSEGRVEQEARALVARSRRQAVDRTTAEHQQQAAELAAQTLPTKDDVERQWRQETSHWAESIQRQRQREFDTLAVGMGQHVDMQQPDHQVCRFSSQGE